MRALLEIHDADFIKAIGYSGIAGNERADEMARAAPRAECLMIDGGYETAARKRGKANQKR